MLKKTSILLTIVLLLSACSMTLDQILGRPTPGPLPTNTFTAAPTFTATVPSPTFTASPTMIPQAIKTPTPFASPTQLVLTLPGEISLPSPTMVELVTQVPMTGFISVSVSDEVFYKGKKCLPVSTKFTANVSDAPRTAFVVLFVRFKSRQTGATSAWTSIGMQPSGIPGIYVHDLDSQEMKGVDAFENAWVQYQFVATDGSKEVGRTGIFDERLSLLECVAAPTPSVTPTVQTP